MYLKQLCLLEWCSKNLELNFYPIANLYFVSYILKIKKINNNNNNLVLRYSLKSSIF